MNADSAPVLVLGMHRSGTSYLAQVVRSLGVDLGRQLIGAQKGNPRGHFEDREILLFHERLLDARLAGTPRAFDPGMMVTEPPDGRFSGEEATEARALLAARRQASPWGWKEPRTALFLEGWQALEPGLRGIVVYRHPWAVHDSMRRREHWDLLLLPGQVLDAYAVYNAALRKAIEADRARFFVVEANAAFADPAGLRRRLADFLGVAEVETAIPAFHHEEFGGTSTVAWADEALRWVAPGAAEAFGALDALADLPAAPVVPTDPAAGRESWEALRAASEDWDAAGRSLLVPMLEGLVFGRSAGAAACERRTLAVGMREALEQEGGWNVKAKRIFEDNQRLHKEVERLGREFSEQQAFLKKQTADFNRIWAELQAVGKSWEAQRDYIRNMEKRWGAAQAAEAETPPESKA